MERASGQLAHTVGSNSATRERMPLIDSLKALGSQLIVLHHLAFYGPMSDAAYRLMPTLIDWLYDHARAAVQVFLVIGGFLAARGLAPHGESLVEQPLPLLWRRYRRLALPYFFALLVCIIMAALVRPWLHDDSVPASPGLAQLGSHALLLHDVLGQEALSAGVWYVAIDFQLFALFVVILWCARLVARHAPALRNAGLWLVGALALASLFYFNRHEAWDAWAVYFFGAYALGAFAWWASDQRRPPAMLGIIALFTGAALMVDFRERILVALCVALLLGIAGRSGRLDQWQTPQPVKRLGRMSYSVFLIHFPVCLLVNALWSHWLPADPLLGLLGMIFAWFASMLAGSAMYRWVESRIT
jgi:peptidoglycan/LPS O-acetylase OafA/YrhL